MLLILAAAYPEDSPLSRTPFLIVELAPSAQHFCPPVLLVGVDVVNSAVLDFLDVHVGS